MKIADVCGTAPVPEDTAVVRCVKDVDVVKKDVMTVHTEVTRKKVVEVKLKNGLFGWRNRRTAMKRAKNVER